MRSLSLPEEKTSDEKRKSETRSSSHLATPEMLTEHAPTEVEACLQVEKGTCSSLHILPGRPAALDSRKHSDACAFPRKGLRHVLPAEDTLQQL